MDYATPLGIIALAGLVHASFQLGVSMMTLLSGHTPTAKSSGNRTLGMVASFFCGAFVMSMLVVSFIAYVASGLWLNQPPIWAWTIASSLLLGLGFVVWIIYYRPGRDGTALWIPRGMAHLLMTRTKDTRSTAEAFSLGLTSVFAELIFVIPPALAGAFAITMLPTEWQLSGLLLYTLIASMGLAIVVVLIGSGRHIANIQRWREQHKRFLQFTAGSGMIILGFFIYVTFAITPTMLGGGL